MAIAQHRRWAWIWQATATDKRVGLVEMSQAEFEAAGERAQDPRVGALHLKHISNDFVVPSALEPEPRSLGAAATPTRRRRSTPPAEA